MSEPTEVPPAETPEPTKKSALVRNAADSVSTCMGACRAPANPLARSLRLGLMLILLSFSIKLLVLDLAISNGETSLDRVRIELETQAKLNAARSGLLDLEHEITQLDGKRRAARLMALEDGGDSMEKAIDDIDEELKEKREEARKLGKKLAPRIDKMKLAGDRASKAARNDAVADGADAISWLQSALGWKIVLDLIKIVGCFLILGATVGIVSSRDEEPALKVFATCCSTIVLLTITAWALLSYLA